MPELPEVETVRRGLEPAMLGARIEKVELRRADIRFPFPASIRAAADGAADCRSRAPRQIPSLQARQRRDADRASRHVGLVPDRGREDRDARRVPPRALEGPQARPRRASFSIMATPSPTTIRDDLASWIWFGARRSRLIRGSPGSAPSLWPGNSTPPVWRSCSGVARAAEGRLARPKAHCRPRQHLRLRGAFSRPAQPVETGERPGERPRRSDPRRRRAGQGDPRGSRGSDRGGRLDPARSPASERRPRIFPARLFSLRPRRLRLA